MENSDAATVRPGPSIRSLTIVLTSDCNLRCQYCCVAQTRQRPIDWLALQRTLDRLLPRAADDLDIAFTGGEPLLEFETLTRVVSYMDENMPAGRTALFNLLTNGLLLDDTIIRFLESHRFSVALSCDGVPGAQALRGRGTFHRLDALLDELRNHHTLLFNHRLRINLTVAPANVAYLAESVDYLLEKRVSNVTLAAAIGPLAWEPSRLYELEKQFEWVSQKVRRHYDRTGAVPIALFRKTRRDYSGRGLRKWICNAPQARALAIDADGQLYGCLLATSPYRSWSRSVQHSGATALRIGDAGDDGRWRSLAAMKMAARACGVFQRRDRWYSSYGRCRDCRFVGRCRICPLAVAPGADATGCRRVPDFLCAFSQAALAARDRFPVQPSAYEILKTPLPGRLTS